MKTVPMAFIGGGHMARALIGGLLRHGQAPGAIRVGEPVAEARAQLAKDFGVVAVAGNEEALQGAELVVLAIKPQHMPAALGALAAPLAVARPLLLSIAAGLSTSDLRGWCPGARLVRAMPNRPALAGAGVSALFAPADVSAPDRALAEAVLACAGRTVWVQEESLIDVVTAVSGSGPAYFFLLAEELARSGEALGLPRAVAAELAAETLYGAGQLAHLDPRLAEQRAAVTSRGGTTAAALAEFAAGDFAALVKRAVEAATRRGRELSAESAQRH